MNGTSLLQSLMTIPEPLYPASSIVIPADGWNIPIHDKPHILTAIRQWRLYYFASPEARKTAAESIVRQAVKFAIVAEGMALLKSK